MARRRDWDKVARQKRVGQYNRIGPQEGPTPLRKFHRQSTRKRGRKHLVVTRKRRSGRALSRNVGEDFFEYKGIKVDTAYLRKGKLIHIRDFLKLRGTTANTAEERAALVREFNKVIKRDYQKLLSLIQRDGTKKISIGRRPGTYFVEYSVTIPSKRA